MVAQSFRKTALFGIITLALILVVACGASEAPATQPDTAPQAAAQTQAQPAAPAQPEAAPSAAAPSAASESAPAPAAATIR